MLTKPMDVLDKYPVRKTGRQKQAFREAVEVYARDLGYDVSVEKGSFGCRNLIIGDPEKADYLVTAHYDTCAAMVVPNFITPCNLLPYAAYQVLLTFGIFFLAGAAGALLGLITGSETVAKIAALAIVWVEILLLIVGPANKHNANDNTSGVVTVLEIIRSFPENMRPKVCFVLFDLEEAGLIGSSAYRSAHKKASDRQVVINLDCVGEGDHILLFPTKRLKKNLGKLRPIYTCCGYFGKKSVLVRDKGFSFYPSDQMSFPYGVGIAALKKGKWGLYMDRIHTKKDTVLEETNVNILRSAIISMICCGAVKKG